jgi:hypothetical protein
MLKPAIVLGARIAKIGKNMNRLIFKKEIGTKLALLRVSFEQSFSTGHLLITGFSNWSH